MGTSFTLFQEDLRFMEAQTMWTVWATLHGIAADKPVSETVQAVARRSLETVLGEVGLRLDVHSSGRVVALQCEMDHGWQSDVADVLKCLAPILVTRAYVFGAVEDRPVLITPTGGIEDPTALVRHVVETRAIQAVFGVGVGATCRCGAPATDWQPTFNADGEADVQPVCAAHTLGV
jgi:hypothetical protein